MSEDVEIFETGPSSGSSTPRHGASPSPGEYWEISHGDRRTDALTDAPILYYFFSKYSSFKKFWDFD